MTHSQPPSQANPRQQHFQPVPMDQLVIPANLDGRQGSNRQQQASPLIPAQDDLAAIHCWLAEYGISPHTQRAYRREAERLLLWCLMARGKALSSIDREDLRSYEAFLNNPLPASRWIGPRRSHRSPAWKPFTGPLSSTSQRQALAALKSLFGYLYAAGYLAGNPTQLVRLATKGPRLQEQLPVENYFTQKQWQLIRTAAQALPETSRKEVFYKQRAVYMLELFYLTAGRISELASGSMGDFQMHHGLWWLTLHGKGRREERIPVGAALMEALIQFRRHRGLADIPAPDDLMPLIPVLYRNDRLSNNMIYRLIKELFKRIGLSLGQEETTLMIRLINGSPHWLRHTRLTHMSEKGIHITDVQNYARHRDANTTNRYQHRDLRRWHSDISRIE